MQSERGQEMLSRFFIILYQLYRLVCLVYHIHAYSSFRNVSSNGMEWQAQVYAECAPGIRAPLSKEDAPCPQRCMHKRRMVVRPMA